MESKIKQKLDELEGDDKYEYMLDCIPYIKEYNTPGLIQRKDIYDRFIKNVENGVGVIGLKRPLNFSHVCICGSSNVFDDSSTSDTVCTDCGRAEKLQLYEIGYKEEQEIEKNIIYNYERKNHLNEWLAQFQAKESTTVPKEVIETLRAEIKKQKIKQKSEITHSKVKEILKKTGFNKYYDHIPYITTILNGINPPNMSQALEEKIRLMFYQVQQPFEKHKPKGRKNFLSYPYFLYKICELLSEDEFIQFFPLLKDREKIYESDQIWRNICKELKWEFIKTAV
jgi:hypothetical protein